MWQLLQIAARSLYFFHPLVWLLDRKLNEYGVDGRKLSAEQLSETLTVITEVKGESPVIYIKCGDAVDHEKKLAHASTRCHDFAAVLESAKEAGADRISVLPPKA